MFHRALCWINSCESPCTSVFYLTFEYVSRRFFALYSHCIVFSQELVNTTYISQIHPIRRTFFVWIILPDYALSISPTCNHAEFCLLCVPFKLYNCLLGNSASSKIIFCVTFCIILYVDIFQVSFEEDSWTTIFTLRSRGYAGLTMSSLDPVFFLPPLSEDNTLLSIQFQVYCTILWLDFVIQSVE